MNSKMANKKLIMTGGIICVIVIVFCIVGSASATSQEEMLDTLKQAIAKKDVDAFLSTLPKEAKSSPLAKEGVKSFLDNVQPTAAAFIEAIDFENANISMEAQKLRSEALPYRIVNEGKKMLLYDHYSVSPSLYKIKLEGVDQDTAITVNGQPVSLSAFDSPLLSGSYKLTATKKYKFTSITDEKNVVLGKKPVETVSFNLKGETMDVSKQFKGAEILFKGQPTGIKVGDEQSAKFGPLGEDEKALVQLKLDLPWVNGEGTYKEHTSMFGARTYHTFTFKVDEKEASNLFHTFMKEYGEASVKQSAQPFTTATEKFVSKKQMDYANDANSIRHWQGTLIKSFYNKNASVIVADNEGNPVLDINGGALFQESTLRHTDQKVESPRETYYKISIKALFDKDKKAWKIDSYSSESKFADLPNKNQEEQYIITVNKP